MAGNQPRKQPIGQYPRRADISDKGGCQGHYGRLVEICLDMEGTAQTSSFESDDKLHNMLHKRVAELSRLRARLSLPLLQYLSRQLAVAQTE